MRMTLLFVLISIGITIDVGCGGRDDAALAMQRATNAIDLVEYRKELRECKEEGKDAGSIAVYERCAKEVDIKFGFEKALDGGSHE